MTTLRQAESYRRDTQRGWQSDSPIAVVGGSAAGFFTAYLLAREGRSVQVFEQAEELNPARRTLIVTSRMRDLLGALGEPSVVHEIRRFEVFTDGRAATIPLRQPDLIIERAQLIRGLAERAQHVGARVFFGRRFLGLAGNGKGLTLSLERSTDGAPEEARAGTVIGADGATSEVARTAGWPDWKTVPLIQAVVALPKDMPKDSVRVWLVPEETPYFYWLIPESPTRGVLGLIGEEGRKARLGLECFLEKRGMVPLEFQGARIPLYTGWVPIRRRIGDADVYLVGDAAAQVKVTTVGGIVTGFRGALAVTHAILNRGSGRGLRGLRRELDLHLLVRKTLHNFQQADYSKLLDLLSPAARDSLGTYSRDEVAKILWRVCLARPRLIWLGIRSLLASGTFPKRKET